MARKIRVSRRTTATRLEFINGLKSAALQFQEKGKPEWKELMAIAQRLEMGTASLKSRIEKGKELEKIRNEIGKVVREKKLVLEKRHKLKEWKERLERSGVRISKGTKAQKNKEWRELGDRLKELREREKSLRTRMKSASLGKDVGRLTRGFARKVYWHTVDIDGTKLRNALARQYGINVPVPRRIRVYFKPRDEVDPLVLLAGKARRERMDLERGRRAPGEDLAKIVFSGFKPEARRVVVARARVRTRPITSGSPRGSGKVPKRGKRTRRKGSGVFGKVRRKLRKMLR